MLTAEEKGKYKAHFLTLGQGRLINPSDSYWDQLWIIPETTSQIFETITVSDARQVREQNLPNFIILIRKLVDNIIDSVPPSPILLNSIRLLTRLLPVLFEIEGLSDIVFWQNFDLASLTKLSFENFEQFIISPNHSSSELNDSTNETNLKSMEQVTNTIASSFLCKLHKLLFIKRFTLLENAESKLWEPGLASTSRFMAPNAIIDSNRVDVLRLMLTCFSSSLYDQPNNMVHKGNKLLTFYVSQTPKIDLLTLTCSIINLICRSSRDKDSGLNHTNASITEIRFLLVNLATQLLTIMVVYPIPQNHGISLNSKPINMVRVYMGKIYKDNELSYLSSSLMNILRTSMDSLDNLMILGGNKKLFPWITDTVVLMWELFQCNKKFKAVMEVKYFTELFLILLYHVVTNHDQFYSNNFIRICTVFMLYLSNDVNLVSKLCVVPSNEILEQFPQTFKQSSVQTYRDIIIIQLCTLMLECTCSSYNKKPNLAPTILTTFVEILYNIIPIVGPHFYEDDPKKSLLNFNPYGGLSYSTCSNITQLITRFSSRQFLLEKPYCADLLSYLIRSVCTAAVKNPRSSRMLLFSILKNEKVYNEVWNTMNSLKSEYFVGNTLKLSGGGTPGAILEEEEEESETMFNRKCEENLNGFDSLNNSINDLSIDTIDNNILNNQDKMRENSVNPKTEEELEQKADEEVYHALRPNPPRGMSARAIEKLPLNSPIYKTWGGNNSLKIILVIIIPYLKLVLKEIWSPRDITVNSYTLIKHLEMADYETIFVENRQFMDFDFLPETPINTLKFNWNHISLGWYLSVIYADVYNGLENLKVFLGGGNIMKNISTSFTKFTNWGTSSYSDQEAAALATITTVNHWAQTDIIAFKIKNSQSIFGRLLQGAGGQVNNAKQQNLVRRFSDYRLNNASRGSISSTHSAGSVLNTPIEDQEACFSKRNSVTSLHSLNMINRTRSNTPTNSSS